MRSIEDRKEAVVVAIYDMLNDATPDNILIMLAACDRHLGMLGGSDWDDIADEVNEKICEDIYG